MSEKTGYKILFDSLQEAVIVVDRDYRIYDVNEAGCLITQKDRDQIVGSHCYEVTHLSKIPCFDKGVQCPVKTVFETGERTRVIHNHSAISGKSRWEEIIATPLENEDGKINLVMEEVRDCSELLKNQNIIEELKHEIQTLQEMLPICAKCKKIRNDDGYWENVEEYIGKKSNAVFTHGLCPVCAKELYPDYYKGS